MIRKVKIANHSGVEISEFIFGAWRLNEDSEGTSSRRVLDKIHTCIEQGITSFDHADIYGDYTCEEIFGKALKEDSSLKSKIEIITKCGIALVSNKHPHSIKHYNSDPPHIQMSVENSLKNLGVDKIDILLLHRPDPLMNAEATAHKLDELVDSGKVLSVGVSNFSVSQFQMLNSFLKNKLVTNQIEISLVEMKSMYDGILDECQKNKIRPMAWSPTAGGKIFSSEDEKFERIREKLKTLAEKYSTTSEIIVYAWLLHHPAKILPILGTNRIDRIKQICLSSQIQLEKQDWFQLWSASKGVEVP
jgi:predicted oxidoreductase